MSYTLLIASYLEPEHVERIKLAAPQCEVIYEPDLIAAPRYPADHKGAPIKRTSDQEQKWLSFLDRKSVV